MNAFGPFLSAYHNPHNQLWDHIIKKTLAALNRNDIEKAQVSTPDAVKQRARRIQETFLASLGGLPPSDTDLNPQVVGVIPRVGYRIEKVIYESEPDAHVTSLLYVPDRLQGPSPAVLFVCGHHREAKGAPEYQRVCHDLVRNGFVVLAVDPTGQGERVTHLNPHTGQMTVGWGTTEHTYQGLQCILTGTNIARYFLFDALRGIDYLQSRPEVNPDRIGVTGNSGGGTQTTLLCMSGDERVKAAVPCTYVTAREPYVQTGQPQDAEQIQFGMTKNGIDFDDMFWPFAPRPLLIGAVEWDFFNPEGTALTYERLRRVYGVLGKQDSVACKFAPGNHMFCKELREATVNWFRKHLAGVEPDFISDEDAAIETLPDSELWCTSKGHVLTDFPNSKTPFHRNLVMIPSRKRTTKPGSLRDAVVETLGIRERLDNQTDPYPRVVQTFDHECGKAQALYFISEPGVMVSGCLVRPSQEGSTEAVIYLADRGTLDIDKHLAAAAPILDTGKAVLVFDVRGTGAVEAHNTTPYGGAFPGSFLGVPSWFSFLAYCMGESLMGMRVFDVLRAAICLREHAGFRQVGLWAVGFEPALCGYLAAALDPAIQPVRVDGLLESFEALVREPLYRTDFTPCMILHDVLSRFDLPELKTLFEGRLLELETVSPRWR